jgi:hypothetical protein
VQTRVETHGVERNTFGQRYWFGRFRRKTCIVLCCKQMVDLAMSMFALFCVSGTPGMIASFLILHSQK